MASTTGDGEFGFQIAPMLDVLFVLLLFFMVSAGAQKRETNMAVPIPSVGLDARIPITLEIAADGQVSFNGASTDSPADHQLPETTVRLKAVMVNAPDRPVIIAPSGTTRHQRVMDVLNLCKAVHVRNITFGSNLD